jgi:bacterioferritin
MADTRIAETLYNVYKAEIEAIGQYMDHHARLADMGYTKLADELETSAKEEMVHAEKALERLLFLEAPITYLRHAAPADLKDVGAMLKADLDLERAAVERLAAGIKLCFELGDHGTRLLLESILEDEEEHYDRLRRHLDLLKVHGATYLLVRG